MNCSLCEQNILPNTSKDILNESTQTILSLCPNCVERHTNICKGCGKFFVDFFHLMKTNLCLECSLN